MSDATQLTVEEAARVKAVRERIETILRTHADEKRTTTDAERETAMAMALKLARNAGLELYAIQKELNRDPRFVKQQVNLGGHNGWRVQLALAISDALICTFVREHAVQVSTKPNARTGRELRYPYADYVTVIGMVEDVEMFEYLFNHIAKQLVEAGERGYKTLKHEIQARELMGEIFGDVDLGYGGRIRISRPVPHGKKWRDDFYRGATATLRTRLNQLYAERMPDESARQHEETMALVPVKKATVDAKLHEFYPKLGRGRNTSQKGSDYRGTNAYMEGRKAGEQINLQGALGHNIAGYLPDGN